MHQNGEDSMKKLASVLICSIVLFAAFIGSVYAPISVTSTIDDDIYVVYDFEGIDQPLYDEIKENPQLFNISTIPQIIKNNLEKQNLTQVRWGLGPQTNIYDDEARAIHVSFYLGGSDIISFNLNATTMRRTYQVKTEWRKFQFNLTSTFPVNFTQILAKPLVEWQKKDGTTFFYESPETGFLGTSFEFLLPQAATQVQVQGDTITYEVPARFEDLIINSPFLIMIALIIVTIIVVIYRKVK